MRHRKTAASATAPPAPAEPGAHELAIVGSFQPTFADPAVEREYACSRFASSYNLVIAYCIGISVLTLVHAFAFPEARTGDAVGFATNLVVLTIRVALQQMQDSYRAYQLFSYFWCSLIALAVGGQAVAQRSQPIMSGLSLASLTGLATIWIMACMYFNMIALAHTPRQLMLASVSCAHASFDPAASVLGRPYEGLFMMLALIVGEALGQKLDGQSRAMFAQRFTASMRRPQPAAPEKSYGETKQDATSAQPASLALVGVIWTAFEDPALEHDFSIDRFSNAYPHVVACCLSLVVVSGVHAFAFPTARVGDLISVGFSLVMLAYRTMLQYVVADRRLAQRLFSGLLLAMVVFAMLAIKALQIKGQIDPGGLSGTGALFAAGSWLLTAFYFTLVGVPHTPRLMILCFVAVMCVTAPTSCASGLSFFPPALALAQPYSRLQ